MDSAAVYLNASTRFSDGGRNLDMEGKLEFPRQETSRRGPMGVRELTTNKVYYQRKWAD